MSSSSALELFGLVIIALICFLMSVFYIIFSYHSRIGFSRLLDHEKSEIKQKVLDHYDELKIAVDYARLIFFSGLCGLYLSPLAEG